MHRVDFNTELAGSIDNPMGRPDDCIVWRLSSKQRPGELVHSFLVLVEQPPSVLECPESNGTLRVGFGRVIDDGHEHFNTSHLSRVAPVALQDRRSECGDCSG